MAKKALAAYRKKRDFSKSAEPSGELRVAVCGRRRFVVQKHDARRLHYDLRLELDGVFKSWAVTRWPSDDPADKRLAVEVEDHPLDYGDFEGTIPPGQYGAGTVQLWDRGYWAPEGSKSPDQALRAGDFKFTLDGERLHGSWVLVRMKQDRNGGKRTNWLLIKHRDASARAGGGAALLAQDRSVASGRPMREIAAGKGRAPKPFMRPAPAGATAKAPTRARMKAPTVRRIPDFIEPQLSRPVEQPPAEPGWVHEVKFDGYRLQLRVVNGHATLQTRNALNWTGRFAAIAADAADLPDCLIDGEVVALDRRRVPSFSALQAALSADRPEELVLFAFDLLFETRSDLRALPLAERKRRLERLLKGVAGKHIRYVSHLESPGAAVLQSACRLGLEGIVSKRLMAPYRSGRSDSWRKSKCRAGQEVVLGGWTTESGTLRSLLAGVHRGGRLVYVGRIGTGYTRRTAKELLPQLKALTVDDSPFGGHNAPRRESNVRWLQPRLVAEIEFAGWTDSGMIRQAAFKALRHDKRAGEVVAEMPENVADTGRAADGEREARYRRGQRHRCAATPSSAPRPTASQTAASRAAPAQRTASRRAGPRAAGAESLSVMGVAISKPDKPLWPDAGDARPVTKVDLARYFEAAGAFMLPHLEGRPCSLLRAPNGLGGTSFFQRHAMAGMSDLFELVKVRGDRAPYVQIDRIEALAAVAQIGGLELHPWNCAPHSPEIAGRLVFDLDPAPDLKFDAVIEAAGEMRERLSAVGLESFCKSTGGKGLHVVTPLLSTRPHAVQWPAAKNFAHLVCAQMAGDSPEKYLDSMAKSRRGGRIFLDYLRNDRVATAVAPLSPRARPGAPVSMPLNWREVKRGLDPARFTVRSAAALLKKSNAWEAYRDSAKSLAAAIRKITGSPDARARRCMRRGRGRGRYGAAEAAGEWRRQTNFWRCSSHRRKVSDLKLANKVTGRILW